MKRPIVILLVMLLAGGLAYWMKPNRRLAAEGGAVVLSSMIPPLFGDWTLDDSVAPVQFSPEIQASLDQIYAQTLTRTYQNSKGDRIMLSVVYGDDQSGATTQVHRPEFCYRAQGFDTSEAVPGYLEAPSRQIAVKRLVAREGNRIEPITYWITVGDTVVFPGLNRTLVKMRYGLEGIIPDGILFRVSSLSADSVTAYALQQAFVAQLLTAIPEHSRDKLAGAITKL